MGEKVKTLTMKEVLELPGWYREEDLLFLQKLVQHVKPKSVVEVGTYYGRSAFSIALALQDGAKLYCVDRWDDFVQDAIRLQGVSAYKQFNEWLDKYGLCGVITPIRGESLSVASRWMDCVDMVHLDGLHDTDDVLSDILVWGSRLSAQGVIVGHDWNNPRVMAAVIKAEEKEIIREVQVLCEELDAPTIPDSPAPDKRCVWTARVA